VIIAFNRKDALIRLLASLESIQKKYFEDIFDLVISIDGGGEASVVKIANDFCWDHGEKKVIEHSKNIGLRDHVLFCTGLVLNKNVYKSVTLLEDDIVVSCSFLDYVKEGSLVFDREDKVVQVSLYSQGYCETDQLPFVPLVDGFDNFYLQTPSSWGQIWSKKSWIDFKKWYDLFLSRPQVEQDFEMKVLPNDIQDWPQTSWKKYVCLYLIQLDKTVFYPRHSYSTNFMTPGVHHKKTDNYLQVPMLFNFDHQIPKKFSSFEESLARYDAFFELSSENSCRYFE